MYHKATVAEDTETATHIMNTDDPEAQKRLGRNIHFQDDKLQYWDRNKVGIMESIVYQKFEQNPALLEILLGTGKRRIAEASPHDDHWGISIDKDHEHALAHFPRATADQ